MNQTFPSKWSLALLCSAALTAACDRTDDTVHLEDRADRAGEQLSREAAEARQGAATTMDNVGDRMAAGVDRTVDSAERTAANLQQRAENSGEKLGETLSDSSITVKAKSALVADPDLSALEINVDTNDGVVTLRGEADSAAAVEKATAVVGAIEGVVSVLNELRVDPPG